MRQKWQPDIEKRPHYRQTVEQPFAEHLNSDCTKWGWRAAECGVKERIAASVAQGSSRLTAGSGMLTAVRGVRHGGQGRSQPTSLTQFGSDIVSENSSISEKKQPFMRDFSSSSFAIRELYDA
jgi:hypothetical protein